MHVDVLWMNNYCLIQVICLSVILSEDLYIAQGSILFLSSSWTFWSQEGRRVTIMAYISIFSEKVLNCILPYTYYRKASQSHINFVCDETHTHLRVMGRWFQPQTLADKALHLTTKTYDFRWCARSLCLVQVTGARHPLTTCSPADLVPLTEGLLGSTGNLICKWDAYTISGESRHMTYTE